MSQKLGEMAFGMAIISIISIIWFVACHDIGFIKALGGWALTVFIPAICGVVIGKAIYE